ncbi:MFS transporter [Pararobbsia silviterrae]|uniref:MFS transporter n=1 Tax=Pararobbsia silviterrae TaxID=1792498 RepID=A0A494YG13_9BURK|nr:MFS transporter [Pararobbsia silviterrae]RKP59293.1 MFS transporter [Pararobbsia silviterrae]
MNSGDQAGILSTEKRDARTPALASAVPRYRWVVLMVTWMAFLLSYVDRVAWSSVAAPVGQTMGLAVGMLGAFVTAFYVGYVIANATGGVLTDVIGGRRMLIFALIALGFATFAFGNAQSLEFGIAAQAIMGITAGADYASGLKIISSWFDRDRGIAMGIHATATSLAVIVCNLTVPAISQAYGWQMAFKLLGALTLAWSVVSYFTLRESPNTAARTRITRSDVFALFRNRNLILLAIAGFGGFWGTVGFAAWGNALMTKQFGISPVQTGSILAAFGIGAVVSKPILGLLRDWLSGKAGKYLPIACMGCFAVLLVVFGQCSTPAAFYLLAPVLGAAAFGYTPLLSVLATSAAGKHAAGATAGLANAVWQLGSAAAPMVVGLIYAHTHSFHLALETLAAGPLVGAIVLSFLRMV